MVEEWISTVRPAKKPPLPSIWKKVFSMDSKKKKNLEETYERIINVGFCIVPYEDLSDLIDSNPVVFGTTKDENIFSIEEVDALFKSQFEQMGNMKPGIDRKRIATRISPNCNNAFIVEEITLTLTSPEETNTIFMRASCVMEYIENRWKLTHWHTSTPVDTENDHWHMEEWKREKEKLQQLVDKQTADLQQKNRELQIEAALERVRARAMAMQHSNELAELVSLVFIELVRLDFSLTRCYIYIIDPDSLSLEAWTFNTEIGGIPASFRIQYLDLPYYKAMIEAWKAQEKKLVYELSGEEKKETDRVLFNETEYKNLPEAVKAGMASVEKVYLSFSFNHFGAIQTGGLEPLSDEKLEIFDRFGNVFDLTYTRFNDLKQAEAQAREAEIQLALERVRAASMAMHKSEELLNVIVVVSEQLQQLNFKFNTVSFAINSQEHDYTFWFATIGDPNPEYIQVPYIKNPMFDRLKDVLAQGREFHTDTLTPEENREWHEHVFAHARLSFMTDETRAYVLRSGYARSIAIKPSIMLIVSNYAGKPYSAVENEIIKRFATVFEQSYTRFLDLQKAEAQAREAQIEAALERVRSRSLAMHKTDELQDVVRVVAEELKNTGVILDTGGAVICTYFQDSKNVIHWTATEDPAHPSVPYLLPYFKDGLFDEAWESKTRGDDYFAKEFSYDVKNAFFSHAFEHSDYRQLPDEYKKIILESKSHGLAWAWSENSAIMIPSIQGDLPSEEEKELLIRFAKVFEQSFIRFLDLQKAEAQAREAQIEVALEKVRSRTMGMQSSEELQEVANLLFLEVQALGIPAWSCGYCILLDDRKSSTCIMSSEGTLQKPFMLPHYGEVSFDEWDNFVLGDQTFFTQELGGKAIESHYSFMKSLPQLTPVFKDLEDAGLSLPTYQINHLCKFAHGFLLFITYEPVPDAHEIFKRFTRVFDQTYTRFLDLKKAEAQAREAQIENALEKVRSRSLAMQQPDELVEVAQLLREEMGALGVEELETSSIYIHDESSGLTQCWFTIRDRDNPGKSVTDQMTINLQDTWVGRQMDGFYGSGQDRTSILMKGDHRIDWIRYCEEKSELFGTSAFYGETIPERTYHLCKFSNGFLGAASPGNISDESWDLMKRATGVFSFAYTRFRDLQMAEASARASVRQASLDRVRADIASMRTADDLNRITPLFWNELTTLGIPFIRCGVFIVHEKEQQVEVYLSKPDGTSLAVMHLPFGASDLAIQTVDAWRNGRVNSLHWTRQDFLKWGRTMVEQGQIPDLETYQGSEDAPESLHLHFIPFNQGMLYVGATEPLSDGETGLAASLAEAFSIAYARYEDFVKLEKAKAGIEEALSELKATQSQLVQQEKLASLGQLTAGIAHEIKNPLNFVNNFSEVSLEMIDEALEELQQISENKHAAETAAILADIKSNLAKIHEHGSRADSIVKSMLMHSRGGTGKMEPVNLNELVKEYVNLSYHGMRAGKNPIDVDIELQLDESVGSVPLIAEDFSRVILNLCTNAFDACAERSRGSFGSLPQSGSPRRVPPYKPRLSIRTGKTNNTITIEIEDNGPGIPDEIKDKILQPFFTTKKGTQGTGLGLSITNDIIKAHGGRLEIESRAGEFTTFSVRLPAITNDI
jgi:signal transduction histidine kinase